jgi:hypothetical protein
MSFEKSLIDYQALCDVFNAWASQYKSGGSRQWVALDGKSLRNTVSDYTGAQQIFPKGFVITGTSKTLFIGLKM